MRVSAGQRGSARAVAKPLVYGLVNENPAPELPPVGTGEALARVRRTFDDIGVPTDLVQISYDDVHNRLKLQADLFREGIDFLPRRPRAPYRWTAEGYAKIYRLCYYAEVRNISHPEYVACVRLERHQSYLVWVSESSPSSPGHQLHRVAAQRLRELDFCSQGVFSVRFGGSVLGGRPSVMAICRTFDQTDLAVHLSSVLDSCRQRRLFAEFAWRPLAAG